MLSIVRSRVSGITAAKSASIVSFNPRRGYAEGDTGAPRPGGDSFTKREKANEDLYVRQVEKEKLAALKKTLEQQREHLNKLSQEIDNLTKK